jgi:SAM-dependent methyltransferase
MSRKATEDLEAAYALKAPEDSVRLYGDWATTYDEEFAEAMGYVYPREVARAFRAQAQPGDTPVLDIGAGTGLLGAELTDLAPDLITDGIDISTEMLEVAGAKGLYRNRITADLTARLDIADETYGGLISSGTFTHGHVGPVALEELLRVARTGALFCLGINLAVFDSAGFGSAFARLVAAGRITPLDFHEVRYYEGVDHQHADDRGIVALFRKR